MNFVLMVIVMVSILAAFVSLGNSCAKDATSMDKAIGRIFCLFYILVAYMIATGGM